MSNEFNVIFEATNQSLPVEFKDLTVIKDGQISLQEKTVEPKTQTIIVEPDSTYQGLAKVMVEPIRTEEIEITASGEYLPSVNKFFSKVTVNVSAGGEQPTLFTPSLQVTADDRLIITDGNGDFSTYVIRVQGATTDFTFETTDKVISLLQVQGLTHNETQFISVTAKGENFKNSLTVSAEWIFVEFTQGLAYTLNTDGLSYTLSGIGIATATDIVIPAEYNSLPVTEIAGNAFYRGTLTSVVFGKNIKVVNSQAFMNISTLERVQLNEGLKTIGASAFNTTAIKELVIPSTVETLSASCFATVTTLESVIFRGKPLTMHNQTFVYDRQPFSIKVPWSAGEVANAPWGATQATITYNYIEVI